MAIFDDKKQEEKLKEIREKEAEDLAKILAEKYKYPYTNLIRVSVDLDALKILDEAEAREGRMAIFQATGKKLLVGILSPNLNKTKEILEQLENKGFILTVYMVSEVGLEKTLAKYKEAKEFSEAQKGIFGAYSEEFKKLLEETTDLNVLKERLGEILSNPKGKKTSDILEIILVSAAARGASDIHIEPQQEKVRLRFRLDGVLQDIALLEFEVYKLILSRIKLLSGLKLNVTDKAQDGRFTIDFKDKEIEIRTSVIPEPTGESVVMRLLDPKGISAPLEELGIEPRLLEIVLKEIKRPNGMLLTTGPTGSGKTTALYAFLKKIYNPEIKIITLEDPVEYHLPGVVQTQINEKDGYSFSDGLRAVLRQDPDVIMVGEIRDADTAQTAIQASLTGHFVLSTLHTNNAAGVVPRLLELKVTPNAIPPAINVMMAQRLIRKLCGKCKEKYSPDEKEKKILEKHIAGLPEGYEKPDLKKLELYKAKGCPACDGTGYKGRIGIFEAILVKGHRKMEELIPQKPSEAQLVDAWKEQGLLNMEQDGILKVAGGVSSLEELARVVDL